MGKHSVVRYMYTWITQFSESEASFRNVMFCMVSDLYIPISGRGVLQCWLPLEGSW